ncbi:hypothetical protein KDN24_11865 [Bacillus sp. Bva_UNVM-123]|uniref:hypothetical protein n=1 Tax=Bacillus sp. Bva_UNVM-123 TaxID=2829798 RepID=UPI00391F6E22
MGTESFKVEFRKHVEVSGDLGTMGLVCPFLEKMNSKQLPIAFCHLIYLIE